VSRPLSNQEGHAFAPGYVPPREPNPLVQALHDAVEVAMPLLLLSLLGVFILIVWRFGLQQLRRRRAVEHEERMRQRMLDELEAGAMEQLRARTGGGRAPQPMERREV